MRNAIRELRGTRRESSLAPSAIPGQRNLTGISLSPPYGGPRLNPIRFLEHPGLLWSLPQSCPRNHWCLNPQGRHRCKPGPDPPGRGRSWVYPIGYGGVNRRPVDIGTLKMKQKAAKTQTSGILSLHTKRRKCPSRGFLRSWGVLSIYWGCSRSPGTLRPWRSRR